MEQIKALGKMVLLRFEEVAKKDKVTKGGIILPNITPDGPKEKPIFKAFVDSVGPDVDLDKAGFKIGDQVVFNDYDMKMLTLNKDEIDPPVYGLCKVDSIWAAYF